MPKIRTLAIAAAIGAALSTGHAMAQNTANNAGIWWDAAAGQPAPFTFLKPLTTVYGRIGFFVAFQESAALRPFFPTLSSFSPVSYPDAWGGVLGIGARLMPVLRYELQVGGALNQRARFTVNGNGNFEQTIRSVQVLNNLYFDFAPLFGNRLGGFNPYVMAGVGLAINATSDSVFVSPLFVQVTGNGRTLTQFAWNAGAGVQWQAARNIALDLGYRYLDAGDWQIQDSGNLGEPRFYRSRLHSHQVMFSVVVAIDGLIRGFGE